MSTETTIGWAAERPEPEQTWIEKLHGWVTTVDHKRLGIMYVVYALLFLVVGGIEATVIRIQLIRPHASYVPPEVFNQLMTMHGTTMIFFVAMPIMFGFANYLAPIMIGTRDMAFPRLNALTFWLTAFGGLLLYFSLVGGYGLYGDGTAPNVGWWAYAPLMSKAFSRGHSNDYWTLSLLVSGFGSIGTAINIIATIISRRCPGMTLGRMPLVVWLFLTMSWLVLMVIGPLTAAQIMLMIDRYLGGHFFDTQAGGSAVLWMHFFWIFGHPEVYVLILPCFGFLSEIIPVFSRKPMFGYPIMVGATVAIAFISMAVWAHHMFTVGMTAFGNTFFVISTMAISVPTGIKIFNWLGTMWGGKIEFKAPMLFATAFLFQFLIAGLTGVMLASAPFTWQLALSYFVVAHFHYVIVGEFSSPSSRPSITGTRRSSDGCSARSWVSCTSYCLSSGSTSRSTSCTSPVSWGCLDASTPTNPDVDGRSGISSPRWASSSRSPEFSRSSGTSSPRPGGASRQETIPGMRGPSSGPPARRHPSTTSRRSPW
jgi:cytochrome c oxidase subunit 1